MAWMVALVLLLFWWLGAHAFHETTFSRALPYVIVSVLVIDLLMARLFRRQPRE
jgi:hypothetical protein